MRKRTTYAIIGTTVAVVVAAGTIAANASWTIPITGTVNARTAKMPKGVKPSVAKQSKAAVVSWSAQEIVAGVKMDRYTVTAHSAGTPARPDIVWQVTASGGVSDTVTFAAAEVSGGTWSWTIVPHFAIWAGAESNPSKALTFAGTPAEAPAARVAAPVTEAPAAPADEVTTPPAVVEKPTTKPAAPVEKPTEDVTTVPAATSPAVTEPPVKEPEPSASGSAPADISQ
ncbi:hypothetical protein KOI35_46820 [Actinoplanes bogorensis]|uniref:Uncharacterized protein n=1 Tax=Paractinoplanes bogorensis TaxID=1610840 RepID=A0ABS5Z5R2_9ACTN|nr:hypothetical protein [Actinoplanes bogorensis]MBU2671036.1 hypothetical protein [Actinoplanes bogorensis]